MLETTTTERYLKKCENVKTSGAESSRHSLRLKRGWTKIKNSARSFGRVFSRKTKSWDIEPDVHLQSSIAECNVRIMDVTASREKRNLNTTFTKECPEVLGRDDVISSLSFAGPVRRVARKQPRFSLDGQSSILSDKARKSPSAVFAELKRASFGRMGDKAPPCWPPVVPPTSGKSELVSDTAMFRRLDRRAIQFARSQWRDLKRMTRKLTKNCLSDLEKARVLFRWVVARDLIVRNSKSLNWTVSTVNDAKDMKDNRELFHRLYQVVCKHAGLPCVIIRGCSKGAGYKPGKRVRGESFRNCWTAVAIDGAWRLVNCTWAARQVTEVDLQTCDEFYFLTDPKEHIFQHYPDDPRWQLLEEPLPFSEFAKLPFVGSPFFNNQLRFSACYSSTVESENGIAEIRLSLPGDVKLGSQLRPSRRNPTCEAATKVSLLCGGSEAVFTVLSRQPGLFYFSIYAAGPENPQCLESACSFAIRFK